MTLPALQPRRFSAEALQLDAAAEVERIAGVHPHPGAAGISAAAVPSSASPAASIRA